ncbi:hypothetical protein GCM10007938_40220 [Vibrio zhanjiangensis]|uniref:Tox-PLDMTX domain-containing protein n=1 Tax=Vibrio zhanjiangensis TaxID=1046128 RepID=A0ABQ6F5I8_9VIBR|nr:M91 family zinc metallopeptidase [Vibrio zhanjiangensis]GLT20239.1 hypothetical protein GCM10007938_40220 [Vibrio zhanjiangensis]
MKFGPGPSLGSHNSDAHFVYREMEKLLLAHKHKHKLADGVKLAQKSSEYRVSSFEDIKEMAKELLPSPPTSIAALKKAVVNAGLKTEQKVRGIQHAASKLSVQEFKVHHIVNDPRMASIVRASHAEILLEIQGVPFETSSFSALIETLEKLPFKEKKAVYEKVGALLSQPSFNTESQGLSEKVGQALESVSFSSPEKNERLTAVRDKSFEFGSIQKTLEWIKGLVNDGECETEQNRKALMQAKALLSTGLIDAALEQLKGESEAPKEGAENTAPDGARHRLVYFTTQLLERTKKLERVAGRIESEISKEGLEKIVDKTVGDWSETSTKSDKKTQKKAEEFDFAINSLKKKSIPTVVSELGRSATLLRDAVDLVTTGEAKEFESAGVLVKSAASQATSTADELRFSAAEKAGKDINPFSKRSRIAKDMAIEAKKAQREEAQKQGKDETMLEAPDAREVQAFLKDNAAWKELQSADDPDFIHLASRVAKEWGLALEDRTVMPSTPEECANQEKAFLQFMSDLGQRKALRGIALALLEDKVDIATLGISKLISSLSTVLIGGITTYMKVNHVDEGVMPGNDYPYKERQQVLYKNLQQVATRLILSMLPNSAQAAIGGGATIVGRAYNAGVDVLGEGQKHKLVSLIDSAAHQAVISTFSDGVEAVVDAHTENLIEGVAGDDPVGGNDNTSIDDNDEVAKLERYPGEVKTWQYEGAEGLSITIEGTEEYYHHVSSVLDELADTEMGEKLLQVLEEKPFSIRFPEEVEHDGISVHPASIDLDNNIIYFDPLNTLSHDSESGGGDQPMLTLAHELIHRLDKENLLRDDYTQPFTAEEKSLLEAMAVGAIYKTPDGQEVDFRDPEVKKKYLKEGAPIFTVNQLRDELGIEERLEYTEGDNLAEGKLHFQHPDNANLRTEVSLYRSWKTLEKQIEETETKKDENPNWRLFNERKFGRKLKRLNDQLNVVNNQIARFKSEVPNIERLAYAKLWLAESEAGSFEENIAEQYLESVERDIESGQGVQSEQVYVYGTQVLALDDFKRETMEGLEHAYASGDRVKVYSFILSKLSSVKEKLANGEVKTLEQVQTLLAQKKILEQAEEKLLNEAYMSKLPEVRHLFGVENDNAVAPESDAVDDASERLTTLAERYQELGREVEEYSGITESQFSRNPDDPKYVEARDRLEGIVSDLSDDYWAITGKRPELPDHGEGYAGLQSLIDTAGDLMTKLRAVERLSVQLTEEVDGDISSFFQDKRSNLSIVNYRDVFASLRENYNDEIRVLEQSEETIINGVPKETLIQRANAKLLLVDQREREYFDKFRPRFSEQRASSEGEMIQEGEFVHAFACLEKAKSNGFFTVDGRPIPTSDLASMVIFVSSPKYNVDPTPITLLEYLTSQDDYSDFYLTFPREVM